MEKAFLSSQVECLKNDLLDIEMKLTAELTNAFKDFETRLKTLVTVMKERTGVFFEESIEEVLQFAGKLRVHGLEKTDEVCAYLESVPEEKIEAEIEAKEEELGNALFNFLVLEVREDVQATFEGVEEHMTGKFQAHETTIMRSLTEDQTTTTERISSAQHARSRDVIRQVVETCENLDAEVTK
jgi:hypothetical protein